MAKQRDAFDSDTVETTEREPEKPPAKKVAADEFVTEEIFKAGKFCGVRMTHSESGVNVFRELRRGQHAPTQEMKTAIKKMLTK